MLEHRRWLQFGAGRCAQSPIDMIAADGSAVVPCESVRIGCHGTGESRSRLGGCPPLGTDIRQRLEYRRRVFQACDRSRAFEGGYQDGSVRGCARGSETAPSEMRRNNLGRNNKSARYPLGQLGVERGQLIREILHQTPVLEIRGDHFGRDMAWRRDRKQGTD